MSRIRVPVSFKQGVACEACGFSRDVWKGKPTLTTDSRKRAMAGACLKCRQWRDEERRKLNRKEIN